MDDTGVTPVTAADVGAAHQRIAPHVRRTPLLGLRWDDLGVERSGELIAKLDLLQPTGSFKVRGATSLLTGVEVPDAGVVAASGGNFGLGIAWAAARLGQHATVVVPRTSPAAKLAPLQELGAEVVLVDGYYAAALAEAERLVASRGAMAAHAFDQREVIAGQGTAVAELLEDAVVDTVLVACGGGGLLAGAIAAAEGTSVRVVAVETHGTATLQAALAASRPVDIEVHGLAASSLGAGRLGRHAWAVHERVHEAVLVSDDEVRLTQQRLWRSARLIAEPGGATALAALLTGAYRPDDDERVAVLVCGANTDPASVFGEV